MASQRPLPAMAGFTLLEIMVALAVFATLAAAVLSASKYVIRQSGAVEQRLLAAWVADNRLSELRLQSGLVTGQQQQVVRMGQRDWWLRQLVSTGSEPRLFRVEIQVSQSDREHVLHRAVGWIAARDE
ncbi:type II secretion system minor pseudopilin GspI [Pseudomonas vancouverensis]|uniref:Type II secretion system protein I n=1 Tax=Pseudomonas vancouverensis TaxID=95300 RepID=A0A1H2PBF4_PSEVA|nr:type II secretion system minor pseudopilin GspI [Pseudomonas vancouverensis]KAB0493854.1 type II secretion system protein GspI [Pseudomonas vancouverensis]TDB58006.1 type II secretion system protein GspI [Pseudomonas vancouverensis]SDV15028.1 general secretion pathway protein I [Pseudomonas vancouverensis]